MKKALLAVLLLAGITASSAQEEQLNDFQESIQDRLEQEPQPETQVYVERTARIEAKKLHDEKVAKKRAKRMARKQARVNAKQPSVKPE